MLGYASAKTNKRMFVWLVIALFFSSTTVFATVVEGPAPDFTLKSLSGKNLKLSEYRGQVVVINFWASWCGPCRQEMPILEELYQRYSEIGLTILGVNVEPTQENAKQLLEDLQINFPVLFDADSRVSKLYEVTAMPSTVIIDRDGNMRYLHQGFEPGTVDKYQDQVKALVQE